MDEEKLKARIPNGDSAYIEAMLAYGAMRVLGKEDRIPDVTSLEDRVHPPREPEALAKLQGFGMVGYHYTDEMEHIPPRSGIDVELGVEILDEVAEKLLPAVEHLKGYLEYLDQNPWRYSE